MKVCDCRNIYDTEPDWESKVMADDFKCGLCQMRLISKDSDYNNIINEIPDSSDTLDDFLNNITIR